MKKIVSLFTAALLSAALLTAPAAAAVPMATAVKVVDYRNNAHKTPASNAWGEAMYQKGNMAVYAVTCKDSYLQYSLDWADRTGCSVDSSAPENGALLAACVYAELYTETKEQKLLDAAVSAAAAVSAEGCEKIDALYMSLPFLGKLYEITGDEGYISKIAQCYSHLKETLFDGSTGLFFENAQAAESGWSRGNGYALSGLADIIESLPEGELKSEMESDYKALAASIFACRTDDGYYTRRLNDHGYYPGFETGGTAFIIYGLAKGINMGLLDKAAYADSINSGFSFIAAAVKDSGQVGFVQPRDTSGGDRGVALDGSATGGYAAGAVMLAGTETEKMNAGLSSSMKMLRRCGEKLGYSFSYNENEKIVTAESKENTVTVKIGEAYAEVNGAKVPLSASAVIFNDRTYIASEDIIKIFKQ